MRVSLMDSPDDFVYACYSDVVIVYNRRYIIFIGTRLHSRWSRISDFNRTYPEVLNNLLKQTV